MHTKQQFDTRWSAGLELNCRTMFYSDNGRPCHHCNGSTCYAYSVRITGSESIDDDDNVYARCVCCHRVHAFPFTLGKVVPVLPRRVGGENDLHARELSALHRSPNLLVIDSEGAG